MSPIIYSPEFSLLGCSYIAAMQYGCVVIGLLCCCRLLYLLLRLGVSVVISLTRGSSDICSAVLSGILWLRPDHDMLTYALRSCFPQVEMNVKGKYE